jgi:hypothetical protein
VVVLSSPGGSVGAAILIGIQVQKLGLDTFAGRANEGCSSACPMILLSGRHVIIQRGTPIGFHAATGPAGTQAMAEYLSFLGFTARQINRLYPGPYLELYARKPVVGWTVWGNEIRRDQFPQEAAE